MNLRTLRVALSLGGFLLVTTPKRAAIRKLAKTDPVKAFHQSHDYIHNEINRLWTYTGSTIDIEGMENIPTDQPCLFAGNHLGFFDVIALENYLPKHCAFVAKDSLGKIPGLGAWMELLGCLFLDRKNMKEGLKTIFKGADLLKDGYSVVIFPEGTRCKEGELGEFKGASLKMAQKAKVPVVPFAFTGTSRIFEDNSALSIKPSKVTLTFGKPLLINDLPRLEQKNAVNLIKNDVESMIKAKLS